MKGGDEIRLHVARELLRIGAVVFSPEEPFTWASGIESPVYVDNRLAISYPEVRSAITDGFVALLTSERLGIDAVVGTATAGIPHAAWLADRLGLPLAYVRGSAKQHGRRSRIEGRVDAGTRVVVVEDLVSTGGSSLDVVSALREAGARVEAVMAIFTYGIRSSAEAFREAGVPFYRLTDFLAVLECARAEHRLGDAEVRMVMEWHERLVAGRPEPG